MDYQNNIKRIEEYVSSKLSVVDAGHDMSHINRVVINAKVIQQQEGGRLFVVVAGALLHDILDEKLFDPTEAEFELRDFLKSIYISLDEINLLVSLIKCISYGSEFDNNKDDLFLEAKIVSDADKLDAMGAIGIARTFHFGGYKNRKIYDIDVSPVRYSSTKEYRKSAAPTINHFYEKLLLLKDKMKTKTGKLLAEQRHLFMEKYLKQFFEEIQENPFDNFL